MTFGSGALTRIERDSGAVPSRSPMSEVGVEVWRGGGVKVDQKVEQSRNAEQNG